MTRHAFFPLLPLLTRGISSVTGLDLSISGMLLSNACFFGALWFFVTYCRMRADDTTAARALLLIASVPENFIFSVIYTESLFHLLTLTAWVSFDQRRTTRACLSAALLTATLPPGSTIPAGVWMIRSVKPKQPLGLLFISFFILGIASGEEPFLKQPEVIVAPDADHALIDRQFQGIPSLAVSPSGRSWATWYAGKTPEEDQNNYVVVATSGGEGQAWKEQFIIDPDGEGPVRAFDPEMWLDPNGRLWTFWAQAVDHQGSVAGVWAMTNDTPNQADSPWLPPRRLTDGVMMCKPTVLSSGEWVLPASTWKETDDSARVVVSTDSGKSWRVRGAVDVPKEYRNYDEHMVVERQDGTLWMLVRNKYGIGESVSEDRGRTWSPLVPSPIQHPSARFFIRRLQSGNLLLVKHGPIDKKTKRSHLTAYVSEDDGDTWSGGLLLDERKGVSYPDGQQTDDGKIHIIYDYSRRDSREILMATFTEADVIDGSSDSKTVSLRIQVSKHPSSGAGASKP